MKGDDDTQNGKKSDREQKTQLRMSEKLSKSAHRYTPKKSSYWSEAIRIVGNAKLLNRIRARHFCSMIFWLA